MSRHCYFIATSWSNSSVSQHFRALADRLAARGHRVVLLVDQRKVRREDADANPAVYVWPSRRPVGLRDALFFGRLVRRYRPDCVIANFAAVNIMIGVGWLLGVRERIAWYHTMSQQIDLDSSLPPWRMRLLRLRKRPIYGLATHLVANSQAAARDLGTTFGIAPDRITVFYYSLPDPGCAEGERTAAKGAQVVCAGRLEPSKGQDVLIRALALLRGEIPEPLVEFVGDGSRRKSLEELAEQLGVARYCVFRGAATHQEVLRRMRSAVVTVVPSRSEAMGCVAMESLAVGTPVIASRAGGLPEMVRDGVDGYLVQPDQPEALSERLQALLRDVRARETMGRNARERFLEHFEQGRSTEALAGWLERTLETAPHV